MPEVVYATPDENGKSRNWDDVFPIWKQNVAPDWSNVNQILEAIAMNNRFGGKSLDEVKASIIEEVKGRLQERLDKTLAELQELPNPENHGWGASKEDITEEHDAVLDKRDAAFAQFGRWCYYIDEVIANLGGAYREYK